MGQSVKVESTTAKTPLGSLPANLTTSMLEKMAGICGPRQYLGWLEMLSFLSMYLFVFTLQRIC